MGEVANYDCTIKHEEGEYNMNRLVTTDEEGYRYQWRYKVVEGGGIQIMFSADGPAIGITIRPVAGNTIELLPVKEEL